MEYAYYEYVSCFIHKLSDFDSRLKCQNQRHGMKTLNSLNVETEADVNC